MAAHLSAQTDSSQISKYPWPKRHSIGETEKQAAIELFDEAINSGVTFGYSGQREAAYAEAFAEYLGGGYADAVNSGSNALYVALRALDIEPFHEVIISCVTDPGGVMPIPLNNLIPIPADVAPGSYNIGPQQIRERITSQTRAVVVTHVLGFAADMTGIADIAREHGLLLIEDCAQSHGAMHRGHKVGTFGDVGVFSMMSTKHHCMGGQGGMVFTRNEDLYWKIRQSSDRGKPFGLDGVEGNVVASLNCNADELDCAIGLAQLKKLPNVLSRRRAAAAKIAEGCLSLHSVRMVEPPPEDIGSYWHILFKFDQEKIRVPKKEFVEWLTQRGIPFWHEYNSQPFQMPWYTERRVFGASGYPWNAPEYKRNRRAVFSTPNLEKSIIDHFMLYFSEAVGEEEVGWILEILAAAEREFIV